MTDRDRKALKSVAASSAMEGLPLSQEQLHIVEKILDGEMTLQDYLRSLKGTVKEA
jgi:hypothetical protein